MKLILILLVVVCPYWGLGDTVATSLMPPGFENVHLGMEWRELLTNRKNLEIFDFGPGPINPVPDLNKPKSSVVEKLSKEQIFNVVCYFFEKGQLMCVIFSTDRNIDFELRESCMQLAAAKYGTPAKCQLMAKQENSCFMAWQINGTQVNFIIPTQTIPLPKSAIALEILTQQKWEGLKKYGGIPVIENMTAKEQLEIDAITKAMASYSNKLPPKTAP